MDHVSTAQPSTKPSDAPPCHRRGTESEALPLSWPRLVNNSVSAEQLPLARVKPYPDLLLIFGKDVAVIGEVLRAGGTSHLMSAQHG